MAEDLDRILTEVFGEEEDVPEDLSPFDREGYDENGWRRRVQPSEARALKPHYQWGEARRGDTAALRQVLEAAPDERPLQAFLEEHARLLAASFLTGGHGRYVRPQVRLGSQWVADFLIAERSSMGLFWTLVEIESPRAPMFLQSGEWSKESRHAIHQILSWRRWLQENLDYARKPMGVGLGLVDIEHSPEGVILVGRHEHVKPDADWLRRDLFREQRILVHSYDDFVARVESHEGRARGRGS